MDGALDPSEARAIDGALDPSEARAIDGALDPSEGSPRRDARERGEVGEGAGDMERS